MDSDLVFSPYKATSSGVFNGFLVWAMCWDIIKGDTMYTTTNWKIQRQEHYDRWMKINKDILEREFKKAGYVNELSYAMARTTFDEQAKSVYLACQGNNLKHMGNFSSYFSDGQYPTAWEDFKERETQ